MSNRIILNKIKKAKQNFQPSISFPYDYSDETISTAINDIFEILTEMVKKK